MNIYDDKIYGQFNSMLQRIMSEYDKILQIFGGDVHSFISHTSNPYSISVPINDVVEFVDAYYIEMSGQVKKIFNNTQQMFGVVDNFIKFYSTAKDILENKADDEVSITTTIALVLIMISHNINSVVAKKIQIILRSMCVQPTVGTLVQVSSSVLSET